MKKLLANLLAILLVVGCTPAPAATSAETSASGAPMINVMTSFNPVDQLVRYIGGDKVQTSVFVRPGVEAHDFEPSAREMAQLKDAQILFINGLDMEPWAQEGSIKDQVELVVLSDGLDTIALDEEGHGHADPHVWLGLTELKQMADTAAAGLSAAAPEHKAYFEANLKQFHEEADALAEEFHPRFEAFKGRGFVTGHEAFGYLTRNLGLVQQAVEGPFAEGEPTPQKIRELTDYVKEQGITTIFVEEAASPKVSETLSRETGAELVTIPTMETEGEIFPTIREIYEKVLASLEQNAQ